MAITDLFKKKPEPAPEPAMEAPPVSDIPVSQVIQMQQQGLTNNQIIQGLQRQGYNPQQIYDALAQAEAKKSVEPMQPASLEPAEQKQDFEALAEQIIEEKWNELQKQTGKINEWKDAVDTRLDKLEQNIADVRSDVEGLHKAIVDRIGEYDKTLTDVGTEIKAMEKVFQKVLPELTSNVQELSRITKSKQQE